MENNSNINASSEFDSESSYWSSSEEEEILTLDSIETSHTIDLGIRSTCANWSPDKAFKELVQNWRDSIISSFNIIESDFKVDREESTKNGYLEILYRATHAKVEPSEVLGYIRFYDYNGGYIDITNRNAKLDLWHLDLGGTSKLEAQNQIGIHGDGLKIALEILQQNPQNHSISCLSNGFEWNFGLSKSNTLSVHLRRLNDPTRLDDDLDTEGEGERITPFVPSPFKDIQILIGMNPDGKGGTISTKDFQNWCQCALFLGGSANDCGVLQTTCGDLVIGPQYTRTFYFKGLLLNKRTPLSASITGGPLKFGYNFYKGKPNRDRAMSFNAVEESRAVFKIWDQILRDRPDYINQLDSIFISSQPMYAEALMAEFHGIGNDIAVRLRDHLLADGNVWYHSTRERTEDCFLDSKISDLGRYGMEIPNHYWSIFQRYNLLRTVDEEYKHKKKTK